MRLNFGSEPTVRFDRGQRTEYRDRLTMPHKIVLLIVVCASFCGVLAKVKEVFVLGKRTTVPWWTYSNFPGAPRCSRIRSFARILNVCHKVRWDERCKTATESIRDPGYSQWHMLCEMHLAVFRSNRRTGQFGRWGHPVAVPRQGTARPAGFEYLGEFGGPWRLAGQ